MVKERGPVHEFMADVADCKITAVTDGDDKKQIFKLKLLADVGTIEDYGGFVQLFDGNPVRLTLQSTGAGGAKVTFDENLRDTHQKPKKVKGASDVLVNDFKVHISRENIANLEAFANLCLNGRVKVTMSRLQLEMGLDDKPRKGGKKK